MLVRLAVFLALFALFVCAALRVLVPQLQLRTLGFGTAAFAGLLAVAYALAVIARPPMPQHFGRLVWRYECGFTVERVEREASVRHGVRSARAAGTFYIVHARVDCPFGDRHLWNPSSEYVVSEAAPWAGRRYAFDASAQAIVDARAATEHPVLGARETETLVFDLPNDIRQPALIFGDTLGFAAFLDDLRAGRLYRPRRFNLRYD